ncbi:uncharacterized protein BP5553_04363 [Venustampulla echinocandica]|uniref:Phenylalanine ammonia-lyase n=1 Tax=Venustampulla echinocandica TaxID=2656787 RepID=A0A370TN18_9HELO|nr:uncharacterized protein BP5553_04363 [Venustampulla echinocandica]RDL36930.1 hypothetical protein BP5553_04363 [Venustampulla echinocandica]
MDSITEFHSSVALQEWDHLIQKIRPGAEASVIDGRRLTLASIVATARYGATAYIDSDTQARLAESTNALASSLKEGRIIYGVNTGFGGSADTRTQKVEELQRILIRELHYGILSSSTPEIHRNPIQESKSVDDESYIRDLLKRGLPMEDPVATTCMQEAWVRAAILVRTNSLASGHSGVRPILVQRMVDLLTKDIVPMIPVHGSISASGDLSPLSYIAGTLQGKSTLRVRAGVRGLEKRHIVTADVALANAGLNPIKLAPKEGLAIVNGTAISSAIGALAMHDSHCLAVLSQVLTCMSVEALRGTNESFDPFFAAVRPHPGQIESAHNIYNFLRGSKLIQQNDGSEVGSLRQDRYSIRTASQWLGPVLEDLFLAHKQVTIEFNSVTDNPLINREGKSLHGGNFQAKAVTSAMEKSRQGAQSIGRMLFTQCTELINPTTNRGLPPNLVADEPSQSFVMKAVDLMVAALLSELGFLANPVGSHVQTAEMGNQALNSLALISARYTHTALDVLSKLAAAHLFALCQALDLRAMHIKFLEMVEPIFRTNTVSLFGEFIISPSGKDGAEETGANTCVALWAHLVKLLDQTTTMDSTERFDSIANALQPTLLTNMSLSSVVAVDVLALVRSWTSTTSDLLSETFYACRDTYTKQPDATPVLGVASKCMYVFVRGTLGVPFLRAEQIRSPDPERAVFREENGEVANGTLEVDSASGNSTIPTVGSLITLI